jgi:hypothetical protein
LRWVAGLAWPEACEVAADIADDEVTADEIWLPTWFPIIILFGHGYVVVNLATDAVHVVWWDLDFPERHRPRWQSVEEFVEFLNSNWASGAYSVDDRGMVWGDPLD